MPPAFLTYWQIITCSQEVTTSLLGGPEINNCFLVFKSYANDPQWASFVPGGNEPDRRPSQAQPGVSGSRFRQSLKSSGIIVLGVDGPCLLVPQFIEEEGPSVIVHHPSLPSPLYNLSILGFAVTMVMALPSQALDLYSWSTGPITLTCQHGAIVEWILKLPLESKGSEAQTQQKKQWISWIKNCLPTQHWFHWATEVWLFSVLRLRLQ